MGSYNSPRLADRKRWTETKHLDQCKRRLQAKVPFTFLTLPEGSEKLNQCQCFVNMQVILSLTVAILNGLRKCLSDKLLQLRHLIRVRLGELLH